MVIGIIGNGKIGLPFGLLCRKAGYDVIMSDSDEDFITNLNQNIYLVNEPLIQRFLFEESPFSATTDNVEVIKNSDIIFTFVESTPSVDGNYDTTNLFEVVNSFFTTSQLEIPIYEKKFVVCSTTNPGEVQQIQDKLSMFNIQVAYNPNFVEHGEIINNLQQSEIVLIGTEYQSLADELIQIYNKIQTKSVKAFVMGMRSAEIAKLGLNSFISTKIMFANMLGDLLKSVGLSQDINVVLNAISSDSRIGNKSFKYNLGFGGPTLPKDIKALSNYIENLNTGVNLLPKVEELNNTHLNFIKEFYIKQNPDKTNPFVIKSLVYKKDTDILESSPQLKLCVDLLDDGYTVHVIETNEIISKLNSLSESYNGRLKFFKLGTNPEGFLIDL